MDLQELLKLAVEREASDIYITVGVPPAFRIRGELQMAGEKALSPAETEQLVSELFVRDEHKQEYMSTGDKDFSISLAGVGRFRVSAFMQRGSMAAAIRIVHATLPDPDLLGIPPTVLDLHKKTRGLILVTGPTGSGKSTTLSAIVNLINTSRSCHILTLEDPIEYLHKHRKSIVNQREVGLDSQNYARALKAAVRQSPDVILVGEMRDLETISIALTAAETGHLVLSSLHTVGAAKTIDRIIDVFPANQQQQVRLQLSGILQAVVSQQLLPSPQKGRSAAFEIMLVNSAIRNLIREAKTHQIDSVIHTSRSSGMISMDASLAQLYKDGLIRSEDAYTYCVNPDLLARLMT